MGALLARLEGGLAEHGRWLLALALLLLLLLGLLGSLGSSSSSWSRPEVGRIAVKEGGETAHLPGQRCSLSEKNGGVATRWGTGAVGGAYLT